MPKYEVETPAGKFEVESESELTNEQVLAEVQAQAGATAEPESGLPEVPTAESERAAARKRDFPTDFGDIDPTGLLNFFSRIGRKTTEAGEAAAEIPSAAAGIVTGGKRGRIGEALRLLEGIFSPLKVVASPLTAGVEQAVEPVVGAEAAETIGSVSELPAVLGLGMAAQAGKLSPLGQRLASAFGVGRARTAEEAVKHDPHLRFILQREAEKPLGELEAAARSPASTMEQLAKMTKSGPIADSALNMKQAERDVWLEAAKADRIVSEAPPPATFEGTGGVVFEVPQGNTFGFFRTLGTPATQATALGDAAAAPANEMLLASSKIQRAVSARHQRNANALLQLPAEDVAAAVKWRESDRPLAEVLANAKISEHTKSALKYLNDKYDIDLKIAIPRLREEWKAQVESQIRKAEQATTEETGRLREPASELAIAEKVGERLKQLVSDNWGIREYFTHTWPGEFLIKDADGVVYGSAQSRLGAKFKQYELVQADSSLKGKLHAEKKSFFDGAMLRQYKDRVRQTVRSIDEGMEISKEEMARAEAGDFSIISKRKFMPEFEKRGRSTGYSNDLLAVLNLYDTHFERWAQLSDLKKRVGPQILELGQKHGQTNLAKILEENVDLLWGYRSPLAQEIDSTLAATPGLRHIVPGNSFERLLRGVKSGVVAGFLKYSPKFQGVNAVQMLSTLWPIVDSFGDIARGFRSWRSTAGQELLLRHGVKGVGTRVEEFGRSLGPAEEMNQQVTFLTMYNKGRQLGLSDKQAGDYAILRGNFYSQFLGALVDQPTRFRRIDPTGLAFMFQRFPVKQMEQVIDLVKDRNFPGAAKWLTANLLLGGFRAATFGGGGWLGLKAYKAVEKAYGTEVADTLNVGLPGLADIDVSGSIQLYNPPFGENLPERIGNLAMGPVGSLAYSTVGAALNRDAPDPSASKRAFNNLIQRVPIFKMLDSARKLYERDYDIKDPAGRLRFKAEAKDLVKMSFGAKPLIREGRKGGPDLDTWIDALVSIEEKRDGVLDYAASRYGQSRVAGVDLPAEMMDAIRKDVDAWNTSFPEFPITGDEIRIRTERRQQSAMLSLRERLLKASPAAIRRSGEFSPAIPEIPAIPKGGG